MNPISPDTRILFLHIPKIGGKTIRQVIAREYKAQEIFVVDGPLGPRYQKLVSLSEPEKKTIRVVEGQFGVGIHKFLPEPSTYFTLLRDPIERAISYYYYIRRKPEHTHHQTLVQENLSLHDYIVRQISKSGTDNGQTRILGGGESAAEHVPFGGVTREMLETAKRNLCEHFAVVGVIEQFDDTIFLLHKAFGWRTPWYTRQNVGANRAPQSAIAPETLALVRKQNQCDLELYAFAQELLNRQLSEQSLSFRAKLSAFKVMTRHPQVRTLYRRLKA